MFDGFSQSDYESKKSVISKKSRKSRLSKLSRKRS